jgi:hypothetical protein
VLRLFVQQHFGFLGFFPRLFIQASLSGSSGHLATSSATPLPIRWVRARLRHESVGGRVQESCKKRSVMPKISRHPVRPSHPIRRKAMSSDPRPSVRSGYIKPDALNPDLESEYDHLREELERLMTEPIKDFPRIDHLVDQLELIQLAIKEQHGIKGNNPNE